MTAVVNFVMLVAAVIGSIVFGVLAAYWVLRAGFGLMRPQSERTVESSPRVAQI
jgi:hypothetical protein